MVDAPPREVVYSTSRALVDSATVLTYLLLQKLPNGVKNFIDSIRWCSQIGVMFLRNANKASSFFMKGPLVKIEIEPNIFVYNNSILRNRHQSPLSASLSVFAS